MALKRRQKTKCPKNSEHGAMSILYAFAPRSGKQIESDSYYCRVCGTTIHWGYYDK